MHVIGIDWAATDERKCGLALGRVEGSAVTILDALTGRETAQRRSAPLVIEWLRRHPDALVAIDAPLGWPSALSLAIANHTAGQPLAKMADASSFFARETDRFIRARFKKTPLEVGADRIARTAFSALCLIAELREATGLPLDLAWQERESGIIEVYPAATLKVLAGATKLWPYKKPEQTDARRRILALLKVELHVSPLHSEKAIASDHVLDAITCVLAGADFIAGRALGPLKRQEKIEREGWIWVRAPTG